MSKPVYRNEIIIGVKEPLRLLFTPDLITPQKFQGRGQPKYSLTVGFAKDHPDYTRLYDICNEMIIEKYDDKYDLDKVNFKFVDGDEDYEKYANHPDEDKRCERPFLKGLILLKLRSKDPIITFDSRQRCEDNKPLVIRGEDEVKAAFYAGAYVALGMTFQTYDPLPEGNGFPGVTMFPNQIVFVRNGERLNRNDPNNSQSFASIQGEVTDIDPTGGEE